MKSTLHTLLLLILPLMVSAQSFDPPVAQKIPFYTFIHQDTLLDNYYWLRDKHSAETINYLYANNAYANNKMKNTTLLQKVIFEEKKSRKKENYDSRPLKSGPYFYYNRNNQENEFPDVYRKWDSLGAKEQLVLDLNKLAKEFAYFNLGLNAISHDHRYLAYGIDNKGNNVCRLFIKNVDADSVFSYEIIDEALQVVWSIDNKSIYYVTPEPKTYRGYRMYQHVLGTDPKNDVLLFEEADKTYQIGLSRSSSKQYLFMTLSKTKSTEIWYWADSVSNKPLLFHKRQPDLICLPNHFEGNEFYLHTNYQAKNYRLMTAAIGSKSVSEWKIQIPHQDKILLDGYSMLKDFLILNETENAENRIVLINRKTQTVDTLKTGLSCGTVTYGFEDYQYAKTQSLRFSVQNYITPEQTYSYNLYTREKILLEMDTILGNYHPQRYETKRIFAKANDGVLIPLTLYYKKGLVLNGKNPVILEGYGAYGSSSLPAFNSSDISYLDRGFIMATAHIRGGKELGEDWYLNGKLMSKKNTFTDFIACAQLLIHEKYTNPQKLAISGASAGGLLIGAVVNMRPDLFQCAVAAVPFVDVINTMLDESIPLTTFEFEEWGNPKIKTDYRYMKSYSPYDNVKAQAYPNMLVLAGYNDPAVGYWEPAKWVSKLREFKTDTNLLLFRTNMEGGHGGASGKYQFMKEEAFIMAFIMQCLGVKENYILVKGKVLDENREPLVYTSIYIDGTSNGTSSNLQGEFELQVKDIEHTVLVFKTMGYVQQKISLNMNSRTNQLIVHLKSENIQLKSVVVNARAKDPAYAIIKEAIRRRKENEARVKSYSAEVYMKTHVRLCEIPEKRPFFIPKSQMPDSNDLGLVYLSESVARYHTKKPDDYKEEMLASKVAGEKQGFSWNRVKDVFFSLYEPGIHLDYYSDRPFISPIAPLAMLSYAYSFKGSFYTEGKEINKIEVIPLRKGDPLFRGFIYITGDDYQIYGTDLILTKDAQIEFVDTIHLKQESILIDRVWMPLKMEVFSYIQIFGFRAMDMSVASMNNYRLNRLFDERFFGNETFKIEKFANKKDSLYWGVSRSIKLTEEENKHYQKADSTYIAEHDPVYLDSIQKAENKVTVTKLILSGYTYQKHNDSSTRYLSLTPLLFSVGFNTVEGLYANIGITKGSFDNEEMRTSYTSLQFRYGSANRNFCPAISGYKNIDSYNSLGFGYKIGRFIEQYHSDNPINSLVNAGYTLFSKDNFMKILQKEMVQINLDKEIVNGLYVRINTQYFNRSALVNHSDFSLIEKEKKFISNNPQNQQSDLPAFIEHQGAEIDLSFRYLIQQKYESMPTYKNVLGSKYPEIYANYRHGFGTKAIPYFFQYIELGIGKDMDLKTLGAFKFDLNAGSFFSKDKLLFADYKHFLGNQTVFSSETSGASNTALYGRNRMLGFEALDYYTWSTQKAFFELHTLHNFQGIVLSKIPLIRRLKAREIIGFNALITDQVSYREWYFGLNHVFSFLRLKAGISENSSTGKMAWFYRLGLNLEF